MAQTPSTPIPTAPEPSWGIWSRILWMLFDRFSAPQFVLSVMSTALFAWLLNRLLENAIPDNARELVSAALGFLIGQMVGPGYQFYLGNTKAAEDKSQALKDNAATMRAAGLPVGGEPAPSPLPVRIDQPPGDPVPTAEADAPRPGDSQ